jgi:tRNA pseudouridine38-40 synthase
VSQRYFIQLSFDGSRYHGWQMQPNAHTVQEAITRGVSLLLKEDVAITGCGRTDTGVHAEKYFAHFDFPENIFAPEELKERLNGFLSNDIAVQKIFPVAPGAHARFSAVSRTYRYQLLIEKDPFYFPYAFFFQGADTNKMNDAAALLTGAEDFASFCKSNSGAENTRCQVTQAYWRKEGRLLIFTITANRFLRNMVRAVVGTLLEVGKEKISMEEFAAIIQSQNRAEAGESVPAKALFLSEVVYPDTIYPSTSA